MGSVRPAQLDARGVDTIEELSQVRTVSGSVTTVTVQVGQRLVEVHDPIRSWSRAHRGPRREMPAAARLAATFSDAATVETWRRLNHATVRGHWYVEAGGTDETSS